MITMHLQVDKEVSLKEVDDQRTVVLAMKQMDEIKSRASEREKAEFWTRYGIRESPNPMLSIPADLFRFVYY